MTVLEGAAAAGAKLVSMENLYMYGATGDKPWVETLPYAAQTRKGKVRAAMTEDLLLAHCQGKVQVAIGRAADFYGPRVSVSAMGERVFPTVLASKSGQLMGNPVKIQTVPKFILQLLGLFNADVREVAEMVYQFEEPFVVDGRKFTQAIALPEAILTTVAWWQQNARPLL